MPLKRTHIYQLKVTLQHIDPPVWRRLLVASDTSLGELHYFLQLAMGWHDGHLHMFSSDRGVHYGPPEVDAGPGSMNVKDEHRVKLEKILPKPGKKLMYEYDFGDGWLHEIKLEKQLPLIGEQAPPRCMAAAGACPPEDIGGPPGYFHFVQVMANPKHPEFRDMSEWFGRCDFDPSFVDLEEINARMQGEPWLGLDDDHTEAFGEIVGAGMAESMASIRDLKNLLGEQQFGSEEEVKDAVERFFASQQRNPVDDFHGLSPDQVHRLIYHPFDSPQLLRWSEAGTAVEQTLVIGMLQVLIARLQEGPVKLTPRGNLPLAVVRPMHAVVGKTLASPGHGLLRSIRSEENAWPVHIVRLLADLSGLVKAQKGKLSLTKKSEKLLKKSGWPGLYRELLQIAFVKFNWAYLDGWGDEMRGVQATAPFMLWLLHRHGQQWKHEEFYQDAMLQAFPALAREATERQYVSAEAQVKNAISRRAETLLEWFGLIELRSDAQQSDPLKIKHDVSLRATDLFRTLVLWS